MYKKNKIFFNSFPFVAIATVLLFSLGKSINYYFYTDDYALLYHIQNNLSYGWPYDFVVVFFTPFYNLFGLWSEAYFALGLLTYFVASLGVYFFIKILTKDKLIAILASLIFATGYIGLDQFTMMSVSSINNLNIINMCIVLIVFILWLDKRKLRYYFLTLLFFWFSIWVFPFRAFPLVLFLPTLGIIKSLNFNNRKRIVMRTIFESILYTPFILVAAKYGVFSYGTYAVQENNPFSILTGSQSIISGLLNFAFFEQTLSIIGKFILIKPIYDFFNLDPTLSLFSYAGLILVAAIFFISFLFLLGEKSNYSKSLITLLLLTIEGYLGYLVLNLDFNANGAVNRYLTTSFLFFSAVIPLFLFLLLQKVRNLKWINKEKLLVFIIFLIIFTLSSLSRKYEESIIQERSNPSRNFMKQIKDFIPQLSGKNIFYFDISSNYPSPSKFGSILLGAFMRKEVVLASTYYVDINTVEIVDTFDEYLNLKNNMGGDNFYSFYYDNKGLYQTTDKVSSLLKDGERRVINLNDLKYSKNNLIPVTNLNISNFYSLIPVKLNLVLKVSPLPLSNFRFPYYGVVFNSNQTQIEEFYKKIVKNKSHIYDYLLSRKNYYENVFIQTSSSHVEGQNPPEFLIDDKKETIWLADESSWQIGVRPWIKIDLKQKKKIGRLVLGQAINRKPSDYKIMISQDADTWEYVQNINVTRALFDDSLVVFDFDSLDARYVMFKINKTENGSTPGFSELEVVEDKYKNVDVSVGIRIKNNPFEFIRNEEELQLAYNYVRQDALLSILTKTNKDENISNGFGFKIPILLDDWYHEYEVLIPPRGIDLEEIRIELNFPAYLEVVKMEISN